MSAALQKPWTVETFLSWADGQEGRHEFDGFRPVAMMGGSGDHNRVAFNIQLALKPRLRGTPCNHFGPDVGVRTVGDTVRFPDTLVTCTKFPGTDRIAPGVVVVFEVISPESGRRDRIEKVREYAAVTSVRTYVIVESTTKALTVHHRLSGEDPWTANPLIEGDTLTLPDIGVEIPVAEFFDGVELIDPP